MPPNLVVQNTGFKYMVRVLEFRCALYKQTQVAAVQELSTDRSVDAYDGALLTLYCVYCMHYLFLLNAFFILFIF